jgi:hypothetical protein
MQASGAARRGAIALGMRGGSGEVGPAQGLLAAAAGDGARRCDPVRTDESRSLYCQLPGLDSVASGESAECGGECGGIVDGDEKEVAGAPRAE